MKSIKTPNHPAYHWSYTLWPLEVWVRGLYNSWWFCVHKLSMFIYLSMVDITHKAIQVLMKNSNIFVLVNSSSLRGTLWLKTYKIILLYYNNITSFMQFTLVWSVLDVHASTINVMNTYDNKTPINKCKCLQG